MLVGESACLLRGQISGASEFVTKVAAAIAIDIDVPVNVALETLEEIVKKSIAVGLQVSIKHVVKLVVFEVGHGQNVRRLRSAQRKRYGVAYEIIVASSLEADVLVLKADHIAAPGTSEWRMFLQTLSAHDGVGEIHGVMQKVVARKFRDEVWVYGVVKQDRREESEWVTSGLSVIIAVLTCVIVCMVFVCLCMSFFASKRLSES